MKFVYRFLFLAFFACFSSVLMVQAQDQADRKHHHDVFEKIDRAYRDGKISIDDKVLFKFYAKQQPNKLPSKYQREDGGLLKCGTPPISDFKNNRSKLSASSISEIESMMSSSSAQASETYSSPSGRFTIYYETSGPDAVPAGDSDNNGVPDYVEWTAAAADSSWNHEIATLGYSDPVFGVSDPYKIYIEVPFFGSSTYGETHLGSYKSVSDPTVIVINNQLDDPGFHGNTDENPTRGAIEVTVAHEFKHAVQYTANQWSGESANWLEMDATLMEEAVYDDVNDYYNYIQSSSSIFSNPQFSFYPGSYQHVTWALYFEEKLGPQFWVDVWETIIANPNITMIDAMTQQLGGANAFNQNYIESQLWHYASGRNSRINFGFEERQNYPTPSVNFTFWGDDSLAAPDTLNRLSAKYIEVTPSPFQGSVSVNFSDLSAPPAGLGILAFFTDGSAELQLLYDDQQEAISYTSDWQWDEIEKAGIVATNGSPYQLASYGVAVRSVNPQMVSIEQNYPNPFQEQTTIRYSLTEQEDVRLEIFDVLGRKVSTLVNQPQSRGIYSEPFTAEGLASGIYFYRLSIGNEVTTKKMTLVK